MSTYALTVTHVEDDVMAFETPSGHQLTLDSAPEPGGKGPTPVELLLASVAACSLMDVASILTKKRLAFHDLTARVEAERRESYPRAFTALKVVFEVSGDVPEKDLDQACRLSAEKYCSVMATVRESPPIEWEAKVRR